MRMRQQSIYRAGGFFLLSAVLHATFLLPWSPNLRWQGLQQAALQVLIQPGNSGAAASPLPRVRFNTLPPTTETITPQNQGATENSAPDKSRATVRVRTQLARAIDQHFEYPLLARRRAWEGVVVLSVSVDTDGRLDDVQLVKSSGHSLLDNAALTSVRRVRHLASVSGWLTSRLYGIQLPIRYQLTE